MDYRDAELLKFRASDCTNSKLRLSSEETGLLSLAVVCHFELFLGGTTLVFHLGTNFKARISLFQIETKFIWASLDVEERRLRGSPAHSELCFNVLSYHLKIISMQVAMLVHGIFLVHFLNIILSFYMFCHAFLSCFVTFTMFFPQGPFCLTTKHPFAVLKTLLPWHISVCQIASA